MFQLQDATLSMAINPKINLTLTIKRAFSRAQILAFAELSGDFGDHHVNPEKRAMAQGLLVASLVTKLGGDMNYVARSMDMEFLLPVYEDEPVVGELTVTQLVKTQKRIKLTMECKIINEAGEVVVRGITAGQIWLP